MTSDPIADMLTRIRNAAAVRKADVVLPHSKAKESVAKLLADNGFVSKVNVKTDSDTKSKLLEIQLSNGEYQVTFNEISRVSKPGRRVYVRANDIPLVRRGRGLVIVSTSKGMMTGSDARKQGIGGEVICRIY